MISTHQTLLPLEAPSPEFDETQPPDSKVRRRVSSEIYFILDKSSGRWVTCIVVFGQKDRRSQLSGTTLVSSNPFS